MERQRTLTKVVDLAKLHREFRAQSVPFTGLAGDATIGGTLRILNADDLSNGQIDSIIAAHVPPTPAEIQAALAQAGIDEKLMKAVVAYLVQQINLVRTQPGTVFPALTTQDVRNGIVATYQAL